MAKQIWIYIVAFLDLLASSLVIPAMAPYTRMIGGTTLTIGLVISTNLLLQIMSGPIAASWYNKRDQCKALLVCLLVGCISFLIMGSATTVPVIFLCRAMEGVFHHTQTICAALLESIGPHEGHATLQRWWNGVRMYSIIIGGVVVGHMMEIRGGYQYVCLIISVIFVLNASISYILIPKIVSDEMKKQDKKKKNKSPVKSEKHNPVSDITHYSLSKLLEPLIDLFHVPQSKNILDVLILIYLTEFVSTAHIQNFAPVLWDVYKTPSRWIGYTLGLQGVMTAIAINSIHHVSKFYSSDVNCAQRIFHGFGMFMLSSGCLYFASSWNGVVMCLVPMSVSYALLKSATSQLLGQRTTDSAAVGVKMSTIARIIAPVCAGLAYDSYGYFGTSVLKVVATGVGAVMALSLSRPLSVSEKLKNKKKKKQ